MNLQQKSIEDITNSKQTPQLNHSNINTIRKQANQTQMQNINNESQFWNEQFSQIPSNFSKFNNSNFSVSFVQGQELGRVGRIEISRKKSSKRQQTLSQFEDSLDQHQASAQQIQANENRVVKNLDVEKSESQISSKKQRKRQKRQKVENQSKGRQGKSKSTQEKKANISATGQIAQNGGLRKIKLKRPKNDNYNQQLERAKNNSLQRYSEFQNLGLTKKNVEPILRKQIQQIQSFINEEEYHQMHMYPNQNQNLRKQQETQLYSNYLQSQNAIFQKMKKYDKSIFSQKEKLDIQDKNLSQTSKERQAERQRQKGIDKNRKNDSKINNNIQSGNENPIQQLVIDYPKELKSVQDNESLQRMWKYGIDKFVEAFTAVAKRSLKLQRLIYSVSKSMMVTSEAMAQNTKLLTQALNNFHHNQENTASYWSSANFEPLVRRRRTRGRKNLFSSYDVINYKTNYGNEPNDFESIDQRIPLPMNERGNLFQQSKNGDNPYSFPHPFFGNTQMNDKQGIALQIGQNQKIGNMGLYSESNYMYDNERTQEDKHQGKRNFGNDEKLKKKLQQVKQKARLKQMEIERKLHNFEKSSMKSGFEDKQESAFPQQKQFDEILKELAVEKQVEKIKANIRNNNLQENETLNESELKLNLKFQQSMLSMMRESESERQKQYNLMGRSVQAKKQAYQLNDKMKQQYQIKKTKTFQSNYLKKLQSIRKDGERRKRNSQFSQFNEQQLMLEKQNQKDKQELNQNQEKTDNDILKNISEKKAHKIQKEKSNKKTINQSFAIRYKNVKYQFSPSDKYLQLAVVDRDTINSISDDNKQKIGTIIPQLDHQYNRHRITFQILHVQSWVAVGICDIDVIRKNRFFLRTKQFGLDGAYMVQSSGMCYSNYQLEDHRKLKGFKFGTGDVVRIILDSNNKIITFIKGKGDLMQKFSMKYDPELDLSKIRFCVGLSKTKDLVSVQNLKIKEHE